MSKFDKRFILVALAIVAAIYCTFFATTSWGKTATYEAYFSNSSRLDSVQCLLVRDGVLVDSMTSTSADTNYTIDDEHIWQLVVKSFYDGLNDWWVDSYILNKIDNPVPTNRKVLYVSADGNDSGGTSWANAFTHPDSIKAHVSEDSIGTYDKIEIYLSADTFSSVCETIWTANTHFYGSGYGTLLTYYDTLMFDSTISPFVDSTDTDVIRFYSDYCGVHNIAITSNDVRGDPESGWNQSGGNNAITFDVYVSNPSDSTTKKPSNYGIVENCLFPTGHKPLQMNARDTTAGTGFVFRNNVFMNPKKHGIDGFLKHSIIENNYFYGSYSYWDGSAAIQVIGSSPSGGNANIIRNNSFTNVAVGIALINSDTNLISGNIFGKCNVPYTSSLTYWQNKFIGNIIDDNYEQNTNNIIVNGGFEMVGKDKTYPVGWSGNGSIVIDTGGRAEQNAVTVYRGRWAAYLKATTNNTYAYLATNLYYLDTGTYYWGANFYPDSAEVNAKVRIYRNFAGGDTLKQEWVISDPDSSTASWNAQGGRFVLNAAGEYYLTFLSDDKANSFFIDNVTLSQSAGNISISTSDMEQIAEYVDDSLEANHGSGSWISSSGSGSDTIIFYAVDTSGTDTARQDVKLTVKNDAGADVGVLWTDGTGKATFFLDDGSYTVIGRATGYIWNSLSYTVSANADSVPVLGYNQIIGNPSAANLSRIYGWVRDITDQPIAGASVVITRNSTAPVVDSSGTGSVVISPQAIVVYTDTAGYWFADVRRTANYDDTTRGFYDIEGTWDTKTLFKINKLYIPSSGNVNLGDTLANRVN